MNNAVPNDLTLSFNNSICFRTNNDEIEKSQLIPDPNNFRIRKFDVKMEEDKQISDCAQKILYLIEKKTPLPPKTGWIKEVRAKIDISKEKIMLRDLKSPGYICMVPDCKYKLFSQKDFKNHAKQCSRTSKYLNFDFIKQKYKIREYCDNVKFNTNDEYIKKINLIFENLKNKLINLTDNLKNNMIEKMKSETKEFNLLFYSNRIQDSFENYKS